MSDTAASTFVGVLVAVLLAIKYWKVVVAALAALLLTTVIVGVRQVVVTMEHQAPVPSQVSGERG